MVTISLFRQKILEQAIRGDLVPQVEHEQSASELMLKINEEKEELIKQKIIKKQNDSSTIMEIEEPYPIPDSWKWVTLKDICYNFGQKKPQQDFSYIDVSVIDGDKGMVTNDVKVIEPKDAPSRARKIVSNGTVIYSTVRPYLRNIAIIDREFECEPIASTAFAILHPYESMSNKYIYYYLRSNFMKEYVESKMVGVAYPAISESEFFQTPFPLPPFEEQKRIIAKVETLFSLLNQWEQEVEFQQKHISTLRDKVLQDSLQGLLVSQDESNESAGVLLGKIHEKKVELAKAKEISKPKPLPPIEDKEKPYELPTGWVWVRLGDISKVIHYGYTASATDKNTGVRMVRITDIQNEKVNWDRVPYCEIEDKSIGKYDLKDNDILIARTGGTVGKSFIVEDAKYLSVFASYLIRVQLMDGINAKFVKRFLESKLYWEQIVNSAKGTGQPNVNATGLSNLILPLPPFEEQKRIAEKIDAVFVSIDELENSLTLPK